MVPYILPKFCELWRTNGEHGALLYVQFPILTLNDIEHFTV